MNNPKKKISRRKLLPLLAGSLVLPFWGIGNNPSKQQNSDEAAHDGDFQTLLKPDGTIVKVPRNTVENARIVKKNISNKSLLGWLKTPNK
ncbi:MAG: hypothetical protein OER83_04475 [Flavobacteriaceae bacterium]|nr:hypothetical protein [Flavobacteriaceae bacterium]MDH3796110.1 hypothetical protein [Flavobacteriaceae bacterium]